MDRGFLWGLLAGSVIMILQWTLNLHVPFILAIGIGWVVGWFGAKYDKGEL